jgi:uncharacterized Fe-S radical SAM superfamily protein PflX
MYCTNCGKLIDDKVEICPYCQFSIYKEKQRNKEEELLMKIKANLNSKSDEELLKIRRQYIQRILGNCSFCWCNGFDLLCHH